jgi:hypothetical protein
LDRVAKSLGRTIGPFTELAENFGITWNSRHFRYDPNNPEEIKEIIRKVAKIARRVPRYK